jgi:hypothetical protein
MPMYLINDNFNTLLVTIGGSDHTITLTNGDYDASSLLTEIQNRLNTVLGTSVITASYVQSLDAYSFSSSSPFSFKFNKQPNTIAPLLGFRDNKDYIATGSGPYVLAAEFKRNFNYNNYVIMDIDTFDILKSTDRDLNKSFAIIPKNMDVLNLSENPQYIKYFSPPVPKLAKLYIKFYDRFGNDYDFQGMDHRFEILLKSQKQTRKYGDIFGLSHKS